MKNRLYLSFCMGLCVLSQQVKSISYEGATVATIITTLGITGASYALFKHVYSDYEKEGKKNVERWLCTVALAAPISYIASVLWFGVTPEARYIFASETAKRNRTKRYARQSYQGVDGLIQYCNIDALNSEGLLDLSYNMEWRLWHTRGALGGWENAQLEESVAKFPQVDPGIYKELIRQEQCLNDNLALLKNSGQFQQQKHNARFERNFRGGRHY